VCFLSFTYSSGLACVVVIQYGYRIHIPTFSGFQDHTLTRGRCHDFTCISPHPTIFLALRQLLEKIMSLFSNARDNMCLHQLPDADDALHFSRDPTQNDKCNVSSYICAWHRMLYRYVRFIVPSFIHLHNVLTAY